MLRLYLLLNFIVMVLGPPIWSQARSCRYKTNAIDLNKGLFVSNGNLETSGKVKFTRPGFIHRNGDISLLWFYELATVGIKSWMV